MPEPELVVDGCVLAPIASGDAGQLQRLFERCEDYFELQDGTPPGPTAAWDELAQLPPGKNERDKVPLGLHCAAGDVVGYVDLVRDYPEPGIWWLGLLLLDPELRGHGFGARIYLEVARWAAARGAASMRLGVLKQNRRAERFWRRLGFEQCGIGAYTSRSGRRSVVMFMSSELAHVTALAEGPDGV